MILAGGEKIGTWLMVVDDYPRDGTASPIRVDRDSASWINEFPDEVLCRNIQKIPRRTYPNTCSLRIQCGFDDPLVPLKGS